MKKHKNKQSLGLNLEYSTYSKIIPVMRKIMNVTFHSSMYSNSVWELAKNSTMNLTTSIRVLINRDLSEKFRKNKI
jgi:hypothetical protein